MCKFKHYLFIALASFCLIATGPTMTVHATEETGGAEEGGETITTTSTVKPNSDTGNAISDILDGTRYQGAISSISWFTERVDNITIMLVSGAAFFIISAAFLKNVCAGVYCANSKFFDKVDDAHKKKEALSIASIKGYFSGGQFQNTSYGAFRDGLLALVPNFKAFTDFEDADIEPKQYFMKSLPQMLFCVIIGIFIYNGYYRDTAMKVGDFGSEAFTRVMMMASPAELLDKLSATTGTPDFSTAHGEDQLSQVAYKISKDAYSAIITKCSDITTSQQKEYLVAKIEEQVISWVNTEVKDNLYSQENGGTYARKWSTDVILAMTTKTIDNGNEDVTEVAGNFQLSTVLPDTNYFDQYGDYFINMYVTFGDVDYENPVSTSESITGSTDGLDGTGGGGGTSQWSSVHGTVQLTFTKDSSGTYKATPVSTTTEGWSINYQGGSSSGTVLDQLSTLKYYNGNSSKYFTYSGSSNKVTGLEKTSINIYAVDGDGIKHYLDYEIQRTN